MQHHKYSLTDLDGMIPWEREIYTTLTHQSFRRGERLRQDK